ncbi:MAG TPA: protein kinase [Thermoanaerobaculia bacterium]|nr:protein kinase [Thermoanaerobaculia bacterium]
MTRSRGNGGRTTAWEGRCRAYTRPVIGRTLLHYRLVDKLGQGGMGEVYRARDQRLDREVALKVLPESLATSPDSLARFEREARALAALSHPGIVSIYSVEEAAGVHFLTMELVDGVLLDELFPTDGLPMERFFALAIQLTEALASAHDRGIVHRDLKPGNVMVTTAGRVKILDFGLAKFQMHWPPEGASRAATDVATREGVILGTVSFMSPEQAEGKQVDQRSDVFSLGVMLYQMVTGRRPFEAESTVGTLAAILCSTPDPAAALRVGLRPELDQLITRCLAKNPDHRPSAAGEVLRVLQALAGSPALVEHRRDPEREDLAAIAVLPFSSLSAEADHELFADGMTEAVITSLAKLGSLKVISRTSVMRYKGTLKPLPEIAAELGVGSLVEGSVLRAGDRVRVTVQLLRAAQGEHLWAESYQRDVRDVLALQEDLASAVAREIRVRLDPHATDSRPPAPTRAAIDPAAYEAYLRGRFHWEKRSLEGVNKAIQHFRQAIEREPLYALAYVGLADCYQVLGSHELLPAADTYPKARAAAGKALEIDDALAEAHASLAAVLHDYYWDWQNADAEYRRALELGPGYATAHHWYAEFLTAMGRMDEAHEEYRRARELDPLSPSLHTDLGWHLLLADRWREAGNEARQALDLDPQFLPAHVLLGWAHCLSGQPHEGIAEMRRAVELTAEPSPQLLAALGYACAAVGDKQEALRLLEVLDDSSREQYVSESARALLQAGLGDLDEAFACLERAFGQREHALAYLLSNPGFRGLRSDPRFADLLRRVGPPGRG